MGNPARVPGSRVGNATSYARHVSERRANPPGSRPERWVKAIRTADDGTEPRVCRIHRPRGSGRPRHLQVSTTGPEGLLAGRVLPFRLTMIDEGSSDEAFEFHWRTLDYVFGLPDPGAFPPCEAALAPDSKTWSTATYDSTRFCRYTKVSATPELLAWPLSGSPGPLLQRAAQASWTCAPDESGRQTPGSVEEEQSRHALLPLVRSESLRGAAGDARICTGAVSRWGWVYGRPSSLLDLSAQRGLCRGRQGVGMLSSRSVVARAATDESEALCLSIREHGPRWQLPRSRLVPRAGLPAVRSPDIGGTKDVY